MPNFVNDPVTSTVAGNENAIEGVSEDGRGIVGKSTSDYGIRGHSTESAGIRGSSEKGRGVEGWASDSEGVVGISTNGNGVWGQAEGTGTGVLGTSKGEGIGVLGSCEHGIGVLGKGSIAGRFEGLVQVTGEIHAGRRDIYVGNVFFHSPLGQQNLVNLFEDLERLKEKVDALARK
jgi:hypothetical protein